ncbi:MAG TPA: lysyl oxidase family protein [Labilithrix sp.]|nr:lysyl oxidase family protein [Labilithrix sp.]
MRIRSVACAVSLLVGVLVGCATGDAPEQIPTVVTQTNTQSLLARTSNGPDLSVDPDRLKGTAEVVETNINARSCAVIEGCVGGSGKRKLLRFDVVTPNLGDTDVVMGPPSESPELYEYSECHRHYHLKNYALYELLNLDASPVLNALGNRVIGHKQAFCLLDSLKYDPNAGTSHAFTCGNQGITAGWADLYNKELDCQWIDVTEVPNGNYLLRVSVNVGRVVREGTPGDGDANYDNNSATVPVTVTDATGQNGGKPRPSR